MAIFAIGDTHLSLGVDKSMNIFGGWENYVERLTQNWQGVVGKDDTVIVAGDISWAMKLEEAAEDFRLLDSLNGNKLILKGNHDLWWSTAASINRFFDSIGVSTIKILHNNSYTVDGVEICGSRGWLFEDGEEQNSKIIHREAVRIESSLKFNPKATDRRLFLHYPPYYRGQSIDDFFALMHKYGVKECYYGHIHGQGLKYVLDGDYMGIRLIPISADYVNFSPVKVII